MSFSFYSMRIEGRICVTTSSFAEVAHSENLCLWSCEEELLSKKSLWHQLAVCGALVRGSCRLSAQTVPENSLHRSAIHFTALNRRHSFRTTANTANNSSIAPQILTLAWPTHTLSGAILVRQPILFVWAVTTVQDS